jgi:hypothetical protein
LRVPTIVGWTEQTNAYVPASSAGTLYVLVPTPLKISPLNNSGPVAPLWWIVTLWGVPGSLLSNTIWNGAPAGAVTVAWSYLIPVALIFTRATLDDPALGAPDAPALGCAPDAPALGAAPDAPALGAAPDAPALGAPDDAALGAGVTDGAGA